MEQNVLLTKMIGIVVAVIVAAVVLVPICNSLTEGDGDNGGGGGAPDVVYENPASVFNYGYYNNTGQIEDFEITFSIGQQGFTINGEEFVFDLETMRMSNILVPIFASSSVIVTNLEGFGTMVLDSDSNTINIVTAGTEGTLICQDGVVTVTMNASPDPYSFQVDEPCYYYKEDGDYGVYTAESIAEGLYADADIGIIPYGIFRTSNIRIMVANNLYHDYGGGDGRAMYELTESDGKITNISWEIMGVTHDLTEVIAPESESGIVAFFPHSIGESGGGSSGGSDLGTAGTIIGIIPVFVILAILMGAVGLFYQNRKTI